MWYYLKFSVIFLLMCMVVLPLLKIENPLRTIGLLYFSKPASATITEHICNPDRTYWYEYDLSGDHYRQRYDGYVETLDNRIPPDLRCSGKLAQGAQIEIKYFPIYRFWSEPLEKITTSPAEVYMYIVIKFAAILLLLWTFLRK